MFFKRTSPNKLAIFFQFLISSLFLANLNIAAAGNDSIDAVATKFADPVSQYLLARKYMRGDGVEKDYAKAAKWFQKAADNNHTKAQFELAKLYLNGLGVDQNDAESVELLITPATKGNDQAQYLLGTLYLEGKGTEKNTSQAIDWLREAADQQHTKSLLLLANLYYQGNEVDKNIPESKKWLQQAVDLGVIEAEDLLAKITEDEQNARRLVELKKSPALRYRTAAEKGDIDAQFTLGNSYLKGENGLKKDSHEAVKWFKKAAEQSHANAQYTLGYLYY